MSFMFWKTGSLEACPPRSRFFMLLLAGSGIMGQKCVFRLSCLLKQVKQATIKHTIRPTQVSTTMNTSLQASGGPVFRVTIVPFTVPPLCLPK
uniref:Uncharacterized protein n=1 Tax=Anguilla anguilla TaxID=7936 RepID=A0A0E9U5T8_ANGAN